MRNIVIAAMASAMLSTGALADDDPGMPGCWPTLSPFSLQIYINTIWLLYEVSFATVAFEDDGIKEIYGILLEGEDPNDGKVTARERLAESYLYGTHLALLTHRSYTQVAVSEPYRSALDGEGGWFCNGQYMPPHTQPPHGRSK